MGKKLALICVALLLFLKAFPQTTLHEECTVNKKITVVEDLLNHIQEQTGVSFSYNSQLIDPYKKITLQAGTYTIEKVLHHIFDRQGIEFILKGEQIILVPATFSTTPVSLEGIIKDSSSLLPLTGVIVSFPEIRQTVVTNNEGHFSVLLRPGPQSIRFSLLGYETSERNILITSDTSLTVSLNVKDYKLEEVLVQDHLQRNPVRDLKTGNERLNIKHVESMPAMFGEADILKSLQMLPGIQSAGEGLSGLLVRGGSADQTLVMLNNATIYSPAHFLGFFSVFNPDAIEDVEIYKGGVPARWGGRLSSIINNNMKTGNSEKFSMQGGIGLISSRLSVEGPLLKNKASFLLSGRRTYFDLLMKAVPDNQVQATTLYFYDLNGAVYYQPDKKNKFSLYSYSGDDVARFYDFIKVKWGNRIISGEWLHSFNSRLLLSSSFHYSQYQYGFQINLEDEVDYEWSSKLKEHTLRLDLDYNLNNKNQLNFGYNASRRVFYPVYYRLEENNTSFGNIMLDEKNVLEHALYIQNEHQITKRLSFLYGLRYSFFHNMGPGRVFKYTEGLEKRIETISDTVYFSTNEIYNTYHGAEPRITGNYSLTDNSAFKFSYNRMQQFTQVASTATASLPQDRWIPSDIYLKPQTGDQWSMGYFRNLPQNSIDFSAELYYKVMQNQIDFKDGITLVGNVTDQNADVHLNNALETQLLSGKAWSYGTELMVRKNKGSFTGWISYTYSRTRRQIKGINNGKVYSPRYDRPHDLSIVGSYKFNKRLEVAGNWVYTSGSAVTLPEGKYTFEGKQFPYYNPEFRNNHRLPDYHRLDLSLTLHNRKNDERRWKSNWTFSLYNTYMRKNPLFIQFIEVINNDPNIDENEVDQIYTKDLKGVKIYFSLIPAISYNFRF